MFKKVPSTIDVYYILQSFTGLTTSPNTVFFIQRVQSFVSKNSYIYVVGEVRGEEALDMLQAMNTGHDGSLSTGHANSAEGMLSRLETMVLTGSADLPLEAIRQQIASAVDYIVHLSRLRDFSRKCMEITEVAGYEDNKIRLNPIYRFQEDEHSTVKKVSGRLVRTKNKIVKMDKFLLAGIYDYLEGKDGEDGQ